MWLVFSACLTGGLVGSLLGAVVCRLIDPWLPKEK